jgi:hypothetical protein
MNQSGKGLLIGRIAHTGHQLLVAQSVEICPTVLFRDAAHLINPAIPRGDLPSIMPLLEGQGQENLRRAGC